MSTMLRRIGAGLAALLFSLAAHAQIGGPLIGQAAGGATLTGGTVTATTRFVAPDGSCATPSYGFTTSAGMGLANVGGLLSLCVGTTNVAKVSSTALDPGSNGGFSLGQATLGWSKIYVDYTNTGTVGAVTINKAVGRVNIAAAGTSIVVTNSVVTAAAHVFANASVNDATCWVKSVVAAAGSFTLTTNAACTAQTSFDFLVINAD